MRIRVWVRLKASTLEVPQSLLVVGIRSQLYRPGFITLVPNGSCSNTQGLGVAAQHVMKTLAKGGSVAQVSV